MNAAKTLQYLDRQKQAIQALINELDQVQVAFNTQFDEFKAEHDSTLDSVTGQIAAKLDAIGPALQNAVEHQLPVERERIEKRRQKIREEYLPQRRQAAAALNAAMPKDPIQARPQAIVGAPALRTHMRRKPPIAAATGRTRPENPPPKLYPSRHHKKHR